MLREGYISEREALGLAVPVLQLSKKGFDVIKFDLGEVREKRFSPQSVTHDYMAAAFQLGDLIHADHADVEFLTEQEHQCTDDSLLPAWVPKSRDHIPDGFTRLHGPSGELIVAIEVELNLKPWLRYDKAAHYFDMSPLKIDVVFWLCDGMKLAQDIYQRLLRLKLKRIEMHAIVLLDDFRSMGWQAPIRSGQNKGKSVRDVYDTKGVQNPYKTNTKAVQNMGQEIFFPVKKTAFISKR